MVPHVVTRLYLSPWGCAISLIQFARSYTPIYCKGTMFRRGTHLITVISPNCYAISRWNVIIWWNLKACQCEGRSKWNEYLGANAMAIEYLTRNMTTKAQTFNSIQMSMPIPVYGFAKSSGHKYWNWYQVPPFPQLYSSSGNGRRKPVAYRLKILLFFLLVVKDNFLNRQNKFFCKLQIWSPNEIKAIDYGTVKVA